MILSLLQVNQNLLYIVMINWSSIVEMFMAKMRKGTSKDPESRYGSNWIYEKVSFQGSRTSYKLEKGAAERW